MSLIDIIPICQDNMSVYSLIGFGIMITSGLFAGAVAVRWVCKENVRVDDMINKLNSDIERHDNYIEATTTTINMIQTDMAVEKEAMSIVRQDISEIKGLISNMNMVLMDLSRR